MNAPAIYIKFVVKQSKHLYLYPHKQNLLITFYFVFVKLLPAMMIHQCAHNLYIALQEVSIYANAGSMPNM